MSPGGLRGNLPNVASVLGAAPLVLALGPDGQALLPLLLRYNSAMDGLDGRLARARRAESAFGASLDNLWDAVAHVLLAMAVAGPRGGAAQAASALACAAILLRMTWRLRADARSGCGSTTNELMRHLLFILLAERALGRDLSGLVTAVLAVHAATLVAPFPMPYLIRTLARTPARIALVNASLVAAWLWPPALALAALAYGGSYLVSLGAGALALPRPSER